MTGLVGLLSIIQATGEAVFEAMKKTVSDLRLQ